jgi:hypothetical protein
MTAIALLLGGVMFALIFVAAYLQRIAGALENLTKIGSAAMVKATEAMLKAQLVYPDPTVKPPAYWSEPVRQASNVGVKSSPEWTEDWPG